jgi:hypothetical protein
MQATYCKHAIEERDIKSQQEVGIFSLQISVERFLFFFRSSVLHSPLVVVPTSEEVRDQRVILDLPPQSSALSVHLTLVKKSIYSANSVVFLKMAATEEGRRSVRETA